MHLVCQQLSSTLKLGPSPYIINRLDTLILLLIFIPSYISFRDPSRRCIFKYKKQGHYPCHSPNAPRPSRALKVISSPTHKTLLNAWPAARSKHNGGRDAAHFCRMLIIFYISSHVFTFSFLPSWNMHKGNPYTRSCDLDVFEPIWGLRQWCTNARVTLYGLCQDEKESGTPRGKYNSYCCNSARRDW
jgi:hypothetical protein